MAELVNRDTKRMHEMMRGYMFSGNDQIFMITFLCKLARTCNSINLRDLETMLLLPNFTTGSAESALIFRLEQVDSEPTKAIFSSRYGAVKFLLWRY